MQSLYSNFRCSANENSLTNCLYSSSLCSSSSRHDAAVICGGDIAGTINIKINLKTMFETYETESCLHSGSIRLVGPSGSNTVEGRVEYCSNGVWGTISSLWFDTRDGEVVCRQLGYQHPREFMYCVSPNGLICSWFDVGVQIFSSNTFGQGSGPVLFNSLSCTGNELSIINCPHSSQSYSYSHSGDIGIRCLNKGYLLCEIKVADFH